MKTAIDFSTKIDFAEAPRATWPNVAETFHACERELGERIGWPALVYDATYQHAEDIPGDVRLAMAFGRDEAAGCVQPLKELSEALADNAGLLALLRELDYAEPARAEELLAQARDAEHPGRELMARTLQQVVDLRLQLARVHEALGQSVAAMEEAHHWLCMCLHPSDDWVYRQVEAAIAAARKALQ